MTTNGGPAVLLRNDGVANRSQRFSVSPARDRTEWFGYGSARDRGRRKIKLDVAQRIELPFAEREAF